jgi:hypothetical protein
MVRGGRLSSLQIRATPLAWASLGASLWVLRRTLIMAFVETANYRTWFGDLAIMWVPFFMIWFHAYGTFNGSRGGYSERDTGIRVGGMRIAREVLSAGSTGSGWTVFRAVACLVGVIVWARLFFMALASQEIVSWPFSQATET